MTKDEALKLALEALETVRHKIDSYQVNVCDDVDEAITAVREALAQPEQEPVAWLITDEKINSLQVDSIQRLIDRARHAHMTDIKLRINGQDEWYQADWLKHLIRATPPQRKPLTDVEIWNTYKNLWMFHPAEEPRLAGDVLKFARAIEAAHGIKE